MNAATYTYVARPTRQAPEQAADRLPGAHPGPRP